MTKQPQVLWAQRESILYLTIEVDDAKVDQLKAEGSKLHFAGTSRTDNYEANIEFFEEIDPESLKRVGASTRVIELTIEKKSPGWWPRLLKEKGKAHWLKVDFSKWRDEDDEDVEEEEAGPVGGGLTNGFDLNQYMSSLGNGGGGADFDGLGDEEDEDEMPELEDNEEDGKKEVKA